MELLLHIAIGFGGGALGGAVAGFLAAILSLQARILRNHLLFRRGRPGIKDCAMPLQYVMLSAMVGGPLGGILGGFLTPLRAALIGALVPAGLLALLSIVGAIWQAYSD